MAGRSSKSGSKPPAGEPNPPFLELDGLWDRTIVIGDIHGCIDELGRLLAKIGPTERDLVIAVGDLVDRGPDSWGVARFFREDCNRFSVLGNHERRIARVIRGIGTAAWSQLESLSKIPLEEHPEWAEWFEGLPAVIRTPHAVVTHWRIDPFLPLEAQNPSYTCGVGGAGVVTEMDAEGVPIWFHQLNPDRPVCIGHLPQSNVELVPGRLYALDTEAAPGGSLTAVVLPAGTVVSVSSARNYREACYLQWEMRSLANPGDWKGSRAIQVLQDGAFELESLREEARSRLRAYLDSLRLDQRAAELRKGLLRELGPVPEPGAERGNYFKRLKALFGDSQIGSLACRILRDRPVTQTEWLEMAGRFRLSELDETIAALERSVPGLSRGCTGE